MACLSAQRSDFSAGRETSESPLMVITPERLAYSGLLGSPRTRIFGAVTLYASIGAPFTLWQSGAEVASMFAVVPPYRPHRISTPDPTLIQILLEAETVDHECFLAELDRQSTRDIIYRLLDGFNEIRRNPNVSLPFDTLFFDVKPKPRSVESRIARIIQKIVADSARKHLVAAYAEELLLSQSRFTHLFHQETGTSLRQFRAWKRARGVMALVTNKENLVEVALSAGFADSTHFSHSVRHFFGLQPRELFSGSRNLSLVLRLPPAAGAKVLSPALILG